MEKRVVLAMVLSVAVLFLYYAIKPPRPTPPPGPPQATGQQEPGQNGPDRAPGPRDPAPDGADPDDGDPKPDDPGTQGNGGGAPETEPDRVADYPPTPDVELTTERLDVVATQPGGALRQIAVWGHPNPEGDVRATGSVTDPGQATEWAEKAGGLLAMQVLDEKWPRIDRLPWKVEPEGEVGIVMEMEARGLRFVKRVTRPGGRPFHLDYVFEVSNPNGTAPDEDVTLEIVSSWVPVLERPGYDDGLLVFRVGDDEPELLTVDEIRDKLGENPNHEMASPDGWKWIGVRRDFFLGALVPNTPLPRGTSVGFRAAMKDADKATAGATAAPTYRIPLTVPAKGETIRFEFMLYTGPTSQEVLDAAPYTVLEPAVPTRWMSFGPIEDLLSWILRFLAGTGLGYGWAVVLLTVVVRGAMFPLSRKSQISMRVHAKKMAVLKPKMDAIKAKYKDAKKQQQKIMEMMRKEKVSLLPGGCLLAFVQMPIWISLYGILGTTFEMRYEGFLWFDDLTAADHFLAIPWADGWPIVDGWLNLLPIFMMITWGISARLQPLPADPQQQQQAKIMRWMPMMFGVMLYNFAAGLCLYMTMSALWSIGEVHLIRKVWLSKLEDPKPAPAPATA